MLYHEVAIEPAALMCDELQIYLRASFGLNHGRFVSALPRDWVNQVRRHANSLSDVNKKLRILNLLSKSEMSSMVIDLDRGGVNKEWIRSVQEQEAIRSFDAIIASSHLSIPCYAPEQVESYVVNSEIEIGHQEMTSKTTVQEVINGLRPFLLKNKCLTLVNAYQLLMTDRKSKYIFQELFSFWASHGGRDFTVICSRNHEKVIAQFEEESALLRQFLDRRKFKGSFKYIAVDDSSGSRLHERYLIGTLAGIELGYGLEMGTKPQSWKVLRAATHLEMKRKYMDRDVRDTYNTGLFLDFVYPIR